jgi:hypothetical protein
VEQHRCVVHDQVLIEVELTSPWDRNRGVDPEDAAGDLVDVRAGLSVSDHGDFLD